MRQSAREIESLDVQEGAYETIEFQSSEETPRMLIADDDPSIVRLLADHCARMGFDVDTASNGIQAALKAGRVKPDILVIDVNMPEVDGLSVCAHLLAPERTPVNVIVISGSRDPHTLERCESFGAHYARKGPDFWNDFEAALAEIHPRMAGRIRQSSTDAPAPAVRRRPRVLLIDDDNDINRFLTSRLDKCGLDVKIRQRRPAGLPDGLQGRARRDRDRLFHAERQCSIFVDEVAHHGGDREHSGYCSFRTAAQ